MSYDLRLFKTKLGEEPEVTARHDSEGLPSSPPDSEKEELKRKVTAALMVYNPRLQPFKFVYEDVAKSQKISVEEAKLKFRHIELNGPRENTNGIQIILFDDEASVTVPYRHHGEKASETFNEIWDYLEIIQRETGYLIFDPQLDRMLDLSRDFNEVVSRYGGVVQKTKAKIVASKASPQKPWWKFW
jgi:hypothetical protein